jgi:hypothetical protein
MAASDARPFPIKNTAYRVTFPILDADGDLVSGAAGLDSEISKDGGTFADCTNEATEIATSSGMYYLDLTATEMNADTVAIIVKTTTTGAKTTPIVLYPVEAGDIDVDVTAWNGTAVATPTVAGVPKVDVSHINGAAVSTTSAQVGVNVVQVSGDAVAADNIEADYDGTGYSKTASSIRSVLDLSARRATAQAGAAGTITLDASASAVDDYYNDMVIVLVGGTGAGQARLITDYVGSTKVASVSPNWMTNPASGTEFSILPLGRVDVATWLGTVPNALSSGRVDASVGAMASNVITAAVVATGAIDADALAADAAAEIADAVWDEDATAHQTTGTFGQAIGDPGADTDTIWGLVNANLDATVSSRATPAQVNAEVLDVVNTDTFAEVSAVPAANAPLTSKIGWLFALARNKLTQTATTTTLRNDADSGNIATASVSDDGTTFTRAEWS